MRTSNSSGLILVSTMMAQLSLQLIHSFSFQQMNLTRDVYLKYINVKAEEKSIVGKQKS